MYNKEIDNLLLIIVSALYAILPTISILVLYTTSLFKMALLLDIFILTNIPIQNGIIAGHKMKNKNKNNCENHI